MSCDPCLQGTTPVSAQLHDSIGDCRQYTVHVFVLCSGAEKNMHSSCAPRICGKGTLPAWCRSRACAGVGAGGRDSCMRGTDERDTCRLRWQRPSGVAARSEGDEVIKGLRTEPTDDATLGAQWDPLLLTEHPNLDDGHDRSERRSSSSTEIRSNSLSST